MPYAIAITEKSLDLIATNNGGLKPEIEPSPYSNGCPANYFVLPDNPNGHAEIVSTDQLFDNYEFIGPESDTEFRPIIPVIQFVKNETYTISRDLLARMVAAHTSGKYNAIPEQADYDNADAMIELLKVRLTA